MNSIQGAVILSACLLLCGCAIGKPSHPTDASTNGQKRLAPCPQRPNCVSSLETNPQRHIPPLRYAGSKDVAYRELVGLIESDRRARIIAQESDFLKVEFRSALFGFVDDVEFVFSADQPVIDVRSASRVGYYDFGANRRRIESIRSRWNPSMHE